MVDSSYEVRVSNEFYLGLNSTNRRVLPNGAELLPQIRYELEIYWRRWGGQGQTFESTSISVGRLEPLLREPAVLPFTLQEKELVP